MERSSDGLIHVKYHVESNGTQADSNMAGPIASAIQMWNSQSQATGVQFDPVDSSNAADMVIASSNDNSQTGGCMGMNYVTGLLAWSPSTWEVNSAVNPGIAAAGL